VTPFEQNEAVADIIAIDSHEDLSSTYVTTLSKYGMIKKSSCGDLPGPSSSMFILSKANEDDEIVKTVLSKEESQLLMITTLGMIIKFGMAEVRPMGLVAAGVNGIKLKANDQVLTGAIASSGETIFVLANNGVAWRIYESDVPSQGRYGQGVILCKLKPGQFLAGGLIESNKQAVFCHFKKSASKPVKVESVHITKRSASGNLVADVKAGDEIIGITAESNFIDIGVMPKKTKPRVKNNTGEKAIVKAEISPDKRISKRKEVKASNDSKKAKGSPGTTEKAQKKAGKGKAEQLTLEYKQVDSSKKPVKRGKQNQQSTTTKTRKKTE